MLTISIATMSDKLDEVIDYTNSIIERLDSRVDFLIVSQKSEINADYYEDKNQRIKVITTTETGLSRSRNRAIDECSSKWLWIQDDDLNLDLENIRKCIDYLSEVSSKLVLAKIGSSENKNDYYKNYSFHLKPNKLNCLKISSIEILVDVEYIRVKNIKFNVDFGLGTNLPCGEENLFVKSIFEMTNEIEYLDIVLCYHTTIIESRNIDHEGRFLARGKVLKSFPMVISSILILRWAFNINCEISKLRKLKIMILSYLN